MAFLRQHKTVYPITLLLYNVYFMYRLIKFLLRTIAGIPFCFIPAVSLGLYILIYYVLRYRRRIVSRNLSECFPDKSNAEIKHIEKQFYRYFADNILEICKMQAMSRDDMARHIKFINIDRINEVLCKGRSVALYLGHFANWEWISSIPLHITTEATCAQIYRRLNSRIIDRLMLESRARNGAVNVEMRHTARFISRMASEHKVCIVGFIADQSPKKRDARFYLNFLNHEIPVVTGTEKIISHFNMDAWFVKTNRIRRGYYEVEFIHMDNPTGPSAGSFGLTAQYYRLLENTISRNPELYLWTHNRFRLSKHSYNHNVESTSQSEPTVDFVLTWVNMNDTGWQKKFARYVNDAGNERNGVSDARFRDNGFLRYWLRGVDRFAPWVRTIHMVVSDECTLPDWLDTGNPRLHIVRHSDIIPPEFLPTFNSVVIERYMHRIPGLSEHFVYFNDDFFITRPVSKERFFRNGLPCDIAAFKYHLPLSQWYRRIKNNVRIINRHFRKKEVMKEFHDKWFHPSYGSKAIWNRLLRPYDKFITLRTPHNAQPYLKETFRQVWNAADAELTATSANKFRAVTDYTPELFRMWQICAGNFEPYNTYADTRMFPLIIRHREAIKAIYNQTYALICINDNIHIRNYDAVMGELKAAFDSILPDKCSFEL